MPDPWRNFDPKDTVHFGGYAGHITGRNFSVQGNTLKSEEVLKVDDAPNPFTELRRLLQLAQARNR